MYKHQTLIVSLNFTEIINLFFKSDWLITMLTQEHVALGKIRFCIEAMPPYCNNKALPILTQHEILDSTFWLFSSLSFLQLQMYYLKILTFFWHFF